jgi:hypothetical protein
VFDKCNILGCYSCRTLHLAILSTIKSGVIAEFVGQTIEFRVQLPVLFSAT